jgi:hypothetical protein
LVAPFVEQLRENVLERLMADQRFGFLQEWPPEVAAVTSSR